MIIKNTNILIALLIVLLGVLYILNKEQLNEGFTTGVGSSSSSGAGATSTIKEEVYIVIPNAIVIESTNDANGTIVPGGYDDRAKIAEQLGGRLATVIELNNFNNPGGAKWYRGTIASGDNLMRYTTVGSGIYKPVYTSMLYSAKWAPGFAVYGFKPSATQIPHSVFKNLTTTPTKITSRLPGYDMTNGKMDILGYITKPDGITTLTKYATKDLTGATKTPAPTDSDRNSEGFKRSDDLSTSFVNYKPPQKNCDDILKSEVYLVTANTKININDLQIFARKFNGRVATRGQFNTAYNEKAQWCAGGAFTDPNGVADSSGNKYSFGFPIQDNTFLLKQYPYKPDTWGWCGGSGQQNISNTIPDINYGVLIYGVKPQSIQPGYTITINGRTYSDLKIWNFFNNNGQDTTAEKYYQCNNATNDDRIKLENASSSSSSSAKRVASSSSSAQVPANSTYDLIRNMADDTTNSEVYYVTGRWPPDGTTTKDYADTIARALGAEYATAAQVKRWYKQGGRLWRLGTVSDAPYMYFTSDIDNTTLEIEPYSPTNNPAIILYGLKPASTDIPKDSIINGVTIPFNLNISPFNITYKPDRTVKSTQKYRKTDAKDTDAFRITVSPLGSSSSAKPVVSSSSAKSVPSSSSSAGPPPNSTLNLIATISDDTSDKEVYYVTGTLPNNTTTTKDNAQLIAKALGAEYATAAQVKQWYNQGGRLWRAGTVSDSQYMYFTDSENNGNFIIESYNPGSNPAIILYGIKPASRDIPEDSIINGVTIPFKLTISSFKETYGPYNSTLDGYPVLSKQKYKKRDATDDDVYGWDNTPRIKIPTPGSSSSLAKTPGSSSSAKTPGSSSSSSASAVAGSQVQGSSSSYNTNPEEQDMLNLSDNINIIDEDLCSCLPDISDSDISSALEQTWDNAINKLKKKAKKEGFMLYDRFTGVNSRYQMQQYQNNLY
jgi:hypothetical protein